MITFAPRRALPAAALTAAALTLTACGSGSSSLLATNGTGGVNPAVYQQVIEAAPVAAASDIPAGSLMATIKSRGQLIQGGTDTTAMFSLANPMSGKTVGFDAGLAAMLAKYIIGMPVVKLTQVQVADREALLQNEAVDAVISTYTITPARARKVGFAGPYYSSGEAILVKKDDAAITQVADLNEKTVCTISSSTAAQDIKQYAPSAKLVFADADAGCVQAVEQGSADAYVLDQAILMGDAYLKPDEIMVVGQPFTTEPYGIGIPPNHPEMKTFVNDWLRKIEADGEWTKLWHATVGATLRGAAPTPPAIGSASGS